MGQVCTAQQQRLSELLATGRLNGDGKGMRMHLPQLSVNAAWGGVVEPDKLQTPRSPLVSEIDSFLRRVEDFDGREHIVEPQTDYHSLIRVYTFIFAMRYAISPPVDFSLSLPQDIHSAVGVVPPGDCQVSATNSGTTAAQTAGSSFPVVAAKCLEESALHTTANSFHSKGWPPRVYYHLAGHARRAELQGSHGAPRES